MWTSRNNWNVISLPKPLAAASVTWPLELGLCQIRASEHGNPCHVGHPPSYEATQSCVLVSLPQAVRAGCDLDLTSQMILPGQVTQRLRKSGCTSVVETVADWMLTEARPREPDLAVAPTSLQVFPWARLWLWFWMLSTGASSQENSGEKK